MQEAIEILLKCVTHKILVILKSRKTQENQELVNLLKINWTQKIIEIN